MKNKLLNIFTAAALSCTSLVSLAESSKHNSHNHSNKEHSEVKSLMSDVKITTSIKKQYLNNDKINSFNISVSTVNGRVTLNGTVPDAETMNLAISIAKSTDGVSDVTSNLDVADYSLIKRVSSDAGITSKIKLALLDELDINIFNIRASCKKIFFLPKKLLC